MRHDNTWDLGLATHRSVLDKFCVLVAYAWHDACLSRACACSMRDTSCLFTLQIFQECFYSKHLAFFHCQVHRPCPGAVPHWLVLLPLLLLLLLTLGKAAPQCIWASSLAPGGQAFRGRSQACLGLPLSPTLSALGTGLRLRAPRSLPI